jgi:hypothetical protein
MNVIGAGPSPAWLGVIAVFSFGGLVLAAFASGYHLASDPPAHAARQHGASAPIAADPSSLPESEVTKFFHTGSVAEPLVERDQAVLRSAPGEGDVVDELPAGRSISITAESGEWLFVSYERDGKTREGWTHRVNIQTGE